MLGGAGQAGLLFWSQGFGGGGDICARLDLNEDKGVAPARDDVYLTHGRAVTPRQNSIALAS